VTDIGKAPENIFGTVQVAAVRLDLLDSIRESMATDALALGGTLLCAEMAGRSVSAMTVRQKSAVFKRLQSLYERLNGMLASDHEITTELIWFLGGSVVGLSASFDSPRWTLFLSSLRFLLCHTTTCANH
jgi:hypothetical protein